MTKNWLEKYAQTLGRLVGDVGRLFFSWGTSLYTIYIIYRGNDRVAHLIKYAKFWKRAGALTRMLTALVEGR
jgi:hypothetical protein